MFVELLEVGDGEPEALVVGVFDFEEFALLVVKGEGFEAAGDADAVVVVDDVVADGDFGPVEGVDGGGFFLLAGEGGLGEEFGFGEDGEAVLGEDEAAAEAGVGEGVTVA